MADANVFLINALTRPITVPRPWTPTLDTRVAGKLVLITGASGGMGAALARRLAAAGGRVVVTARRADELNELVASIRAAGGDAFALPGDLSTEEGIDAVASEVLGQFGVPDLLVLNAGRSIMRSIAESETRLHDFQRTLAINYLGGAGLMLRFLPGMRRRGSGHVVHSSSVAAISNLPFFAAYAGSKAALDTVVRIAGIEALSDGVKVTNVHLPLVDTDMIAPTNWGKYNRLTLDQGVDMLEQAIRRQPREVNNPLGAITRAAFGLTPRTVSRAQNRYFRQLQREPLHAEGRADGGSIDGR